MSTTRRHLVESLHQNLVLVGEGEPMLRLEKLMHCALAGLGLKLPISVQRDPASFGLGHEDMPAVLLGGKVVFAGLPRTEELEAWLRKIIAVAPLSNPYCGLSPVCGQVIGGRPYVLSQRKAE